MKSKKFNFILFLFQKHNNQDEFVVDIAGEIALLTKSSNVRYYYGSEASVYTFSTNVKLKEVNEYLDIILSDESPAYFLLPYDTDNMSTGLPDSITKHLFGDGLPDKLSDIKFTEQKLNDFSLLNDEMFEEMLSQFNDDEDDDEISKLIKRTKEVKVNDFVTEEQFNDILDKINSTGRASLTEKEVSLLNKYSKQIK